MGIKKNLFGRILEKVSSGASFLYEKVTRIGDDFIERPGNIMKTGFMQATSALIYGSLLSIALNYLPLNNQKSYNHSQLSSPNSTLAKSEIPYSGNLEGNLELLLNSPQGLSFKTEPELESLTVYPHNQSIEESLVDSEINSQNYASLVAFEKNRNNFIEKRHDPDAFSSFSYSVEAENYINYEEKVIDPEKETLTSFLERNGFSRSEARRIAPEVASFNGIRYSSKANWYNVNDAPSNDKGQRVVKIPIEKTRYALASFDLLASPDIKPYFQTNPNPIEEPISEESVLTADITEASENSLKDSTAIDESYLSFVINPEKETLTSFLERNGFSRSEARRIAPEVASLNGISYSSKANWYNVYGAPTNDKGDQIVRIPTNLIETAGIMPFESLAESPVKSPVDYLVESPVKSPVESPVDYLVESPVETRLEFSKYNDIELAIARSIASNADKTNADIRLTKDTKSSVADVGMPKTDTKSSVADVGMPKTDTKSSVADVGMPTNFYIVEKGDYLSRIADKLNIEPKVIRDLNPDLNYNLATGSHKMIHPEDKLAIPSDIDYQPKVASLSHRKKVPSSRASKSSRDSKDSLEFRLGMGEFSSQDTSVSYNGKTINDILLSNNINPDKYWSWISSLPGLTTSRKNHIRKNGLTEQKLEVLDRIAKRLQQHNYSENDICRFLAIAYRESDYVPTTHANASKGLPRDDSYGVFQINFLAGHHKNKNHQQIAIGHGFSTDYQGMAYCMKNVECGTDVAVALQRATKSFSPWKANPVN